MDGYYLVPFSTLIDSRNHTRRRERERERDRASPAGRRHGFFFISDRRGGRSARLISACAAHLVVAAGLTRKRSDQRVTHSSTHSHMGPTSRGASRWLCGDSGHMSGSGWTAAAKNSIKQTCANKLLSPPFPSYYQRHLCAFIRCNSYVL